MAIKFKPWIVPNFITSEAPNGAAWPIKRLDADELSKQCDLFRAEIFRKAGKKDPAKRRPYSKRPNPAASQKARIDASE